MSVIFSNISFNKISLALLCLIAFFMPFSKTLSSVPMLLLAVLWLVNFPETTRLKQMLKQYRFWAATIFFFIIIPGVFISQNQTAALFNVKLYLPFLLFPTLFFAFDIPNKNAVLKFFVAGCGLATAWCYAIAGWAFYASGANNFFYNKLSIIHPTYFSAYLLFAAIITGHHLVVQRHYSRYYKVGLLLLTVHFMSFILLLSSRAAILAMFLLFNLSVIIYFLRKNISLITLALLLMLNFIPVITVLNNKNIKYRFMEIAQLDLASKQESSAGNRVEIWKASWQAIKKSKWLGVGSGDVSDVLLKIYEENSFQKGMKRKFNAHNQYLQVLLSTGIIGAVFFLWGVFTSLIHALKTDSRIHLMFLFICCIIFFTESFLQSQSGVVFFALFNSMLINKQT